MSVATNSDAASRTRRDAARKAWRTRRSLSAFAKARAAEAASKEALRIYSKAHKWSLAFFEGPTGSPRTGIIDAIAFRLGRDADSLEVRLIQLKGGHAGVSGTEIARLKAAAAGAQVNWLIAAFDGEVLHLIPDDPIEKRPRVGKGLQAGTARPKPSPNSTRARLAPRRHERA